MEHHFDIEIAENYGLIEAIILNNLWFWVKKNEANEVHFHDGTYWTYNSVKAMGKLHPYLSEKRIRGALDRLKEKGIIMIGNYNKSAYDRTAWYAFTEKGKCIMTKGQMEDDEKSNGNEQKGEPIPYTNTDINHISKTQIKEEFENLWSLYPKKQGKDRAYSCYEKARMTGTTYEEVENGINAYSLYVKANGTDMKYIKMGSTFFSQKAWKDDWAEHKNIKGNPFLEMLQNGDY